MNIVRAVRFLLSPGLRFDRARLARAVSLMLAGYVAAPLAAVALGRFTDDAIAGRFHSMSGLAVVIALLLVAALMTNHFAHLDYYELAESQETRVRTELIDLVNGTSRIDHLDDARFADDLSLVREALFSNTHAHTAVLQLGGLIIQTAITATILVTLSPWLVFLPVVAVLPVLFARRAHTVSERARERIAERLRLNMHLVELSTNAASVKELRIFGTAKELQARQEDNWRTITREMWRGQAGSAAWRATGQLAFALGYGGAIFLLVNQAVTGRATIGDLILVITLAVQVSTQIVAALQLLETVEATGRTAQRIESLLASAPRPVSSTEAGADPIFGVPPSAPGRIRGDISLQNVSFRYPGSDRPVLDDVNLSIPAGTTLAIVGENGAGKSTLVNLLTGMYAPTSGRILVDGMDVTGIDLTRWRAATAALFQDFYRFQFTLREGIGLGDVDRLDEESALRATIDRARAQQVVDRVPGGMSGFTGHGYADGTDLSGGQWQLVGLARCLMRDQPQLLILDEPAAALDAEAEHALFERYASSASAAARQTGGITILISHRFSTVLMADAICVLDRGRLIEHGSHQQLLAGDGVYAELFQMQARAYS